MLCPTAGQGSCWHLLTFLSYVRRQGFWKWAVQVEFKPQILPPGIKAKEGNLSSGAKRVHLWRFVFSPALIPHLDRFITKPFSLYVKPFLERCAVFHCSPHMRTSTRGQFSVITPVVRNPTASLGVSAYGVFLLRAMGPSPLMEKMEP